MLKKEEGIDKYYFETLDNLLTKLKNMVQYLTSRIDALKAIHNAREKNDSHRMTVVYIDHYEIILKNIKAIFNTSFAEGPLKKYLVHMYEHSNQNDIRNKMIREPLEEIINKLRGNKQAYGFQEFWAELSMSIYRFSQKFYSETMENNFINAFVDALSMANEYIDAIYQEIINFNLREMTLGFPDEIVQNP